MCCRADRRGIQHFFCSLCPMVVNGLTTRRDFNKTTKYRRFWREITPLGQRLQKKCYIPWQSAWQDEDFGTLHLMRTTFLMPKNLPNTLVDFQDFQKNYLLTKLKITLAIGPNFVWQNFEKEKSEVTKFFAFPSRSSWYVTFFPETLSKGSKLA